MHPESFVPIPQSQGQSGYWASLGVDLVRAMAVAAMGVMLREVATTVQRRLGGPTSSSDAFFD